MLHPIPENIRRELKALVKSGRVHFRGDGSLSDAEFRDLGHDRVPLEPEHEAVVFPGTVEEIAGVLRVAEREKIGIVPSGGRTGYAAGAYAGPGEIVLSLARMNRVLSFDPYGPSLTVEAGMITRHVQEEAARHGFLFPVDFASAGSSQIGGNAATNAGGIRVIRYGMMREWVQGMRVVTGTGEIVLFPGSVLKNNTGYDLCRLFVGSEGTLGVIAELTLRLAKPVRETALLLASVGAFRDVKSTLAQAHALGNPLLAFEYFDQACLLSVMKHLGLPHPFQGQGEHFLLIEWESRDAEESVSLFDAFARSLGTRILGARPALTLSQGRELWKYREGISESISSHRPQKQDISLPADATPGFLESLDHFSSMHRDFKGAGHFVFGHIGDGNLHLNTAWPDAWPEERRRAASSALDDFVFTQVIAAGGSISAEHGIGLLKKNDLARMRSPIEIDAMRALKRVWDPHGILNPGKLFPT